MERVGGLSCGSSTVPPTLHGQLFLLAFDPKQGTFDGHDPALFGLALRAAMLTDLQLSGYLVERGGRAVPGKAASPDDPILRAEFAQVGVHNRATWAQLVAGNAHEAITAVREQLVAAGWLRPGRNRVLGVPAGNLEPYDACRVAALADDVGGALRNAIAGFPAEPWLLAAGLLAALAGLPGLGDPGDDPERRYRLQELARDVCAPISGLVEAIGGHRENIGAEVAGGSP
ncbi:GPP34 family phosphoprotein [Mycobacterium sp. CVI_P3]|uniref:GPP34 family phosphoprotein n=1 Tax=Mycobacterium pinniadriaticum TaxID=2994102 RepID=A0ABT3SJE3_9MYCO|nr:GPP34 family phosphoprotein [Mycobacterium pinniadriaticum]MCX2933226.1 GPP34 family phosphoprotein [Mycobacterium pinniadriaticum]MCX2939648.1 GPP34 family phosphoprotein [Mycobacterium pinniadriaticum]